MASVDGALGGPFLTPWGTIGSSPRWVWLVGGAFPCGEVAGLALMCEFLTEA